MSGAIFGGDEIDAIVLDVGTFTTRAGFAGQDRPEIDIPTFMGYRNNGEFLSSDPKYPNYLCGVNRINTVNENIDIINPLKDGLVHDWAAYECLLNHVFSSELHVLPDEHPLIITEQPWSNSAQRESLAELLFEKFCVTALYVARTPVLTSFAHAKSTALVIDSGYSCTSVTPVVDGYALKKNAIHIPLAGAFLEEKTADLLKKLNIEIIPQYMVAKKETTPDNAPAIYTLKKIPNVKESWHEYMLKNTYQDFYTSVLQVSDVPLAENFHQSPVYYEFPNGFYRSFTEERFMIPELLFNPTNINDMTSVSALGVHNIAVNCALSCDVDVRSQLLNNIAVVGGTSLMPGYMDRLQHGLASSVPPNMKHKVLTSSYPGDRRFSAWVGGSILASMGTFHQLWVSKAEYVESGRRSVDIKCS